MAFKVHRFFEIMDSINIFTDTKLLLGTITGVDKSVWGGIRKKYNKQEDQKSDKSENAKNENVQGEETDKQEQPGFLARIKKAIFG